LSYRTDSSPSPSFSRRVAAARAPMPRRIEPGRAQRRRRDAAFDDRLIHTLMSEDHHLETKT
jgi:hypothetical protein